jgi:hypothetical protein
MTRSMTWLAGMTTPMAWLVGLPWPLQLLAILFLGAALIIYASAAYRRAGK